MMSVIWMDKRLDWSFWLHPHKPWQDNQHTKPYILMLEIKNKAHSQDQTLRWMVNERKNYRPLMMRASTHEQQQEQRSSFITTALATATYQSASSSPAHTTVRATHLCAPFINKRYGTWPLSYVSTVRYRGIALKIETNCKSSVQTTSLKNASGDLNKQLRTPHSDKNRL